MKRVEAAISRMQAQERLMNMLDEQSEASLAEEAKQNALRMQVATDGLELMLRGRIDKLCAVYERISNNYDRTYTWKLAAMCLNALKEPVKWRRAIKFQNKHRIRRWLRICVRLRVLDANIHKYRRLHVMRSCLFGWLYVTADSLARLTPGLGPELKRRRFRMTLFSRLLRAERNEKCPRCLFARWLEYTQHCVIKRNIVKCSRNRLDAKLMGRVFNALHGDVTASVEEGVKVGATEEIVGAAVEEAGGGGGGEEGEGAGDGDALAHQEDPGRIRYSRIGAVIETSGIGGDLELRWATELDRWVTKLARPETFSEWIRRKNRWVKRRMKRLAGESAMRVALLAYREEIIQRIKREADLHYEDQGKPGGTPSPYFTGAIQLREVELNSLWHACGAVAKAIYYTDKVDSPKFCEALRPVHIAVGVAKWMFNSLNHGLPKLGSMGINNVQLPTKEADPKYWEHFEWLIRQSERRTTQSRVNSA